MVSRQEPQEVVVITGASSGIGRATAQAFARRGARIGLLARGADALDAARREVEELGGEALALPVDVSDAYQVEEAAAAVEAAFGPMDTWINNAMVSVFSPVDLMTPEEYRRVTEVTYLGYVHGTLAALRRMKPRDRGTIVQVGSVLAYLGAPLQSAYAAAKHAIRGFTDSLRAELVHDRSRVHITMVHLPAVNTPQFEMARSHLAQRPEPQGRVLQPEVAADAIVFAAHHRRREVYVGLQSVEAAVASTAAPALVDRYLAQTVPEENEDAPSESPRPDNLWEPLPGGHGLHGPFDDRARGTSPQLWITKNRLWLGLALASATAATVAAVWWWSRQPRTGLPRE